MNAKVDAITDAVEAAIARGNNHPGGVRRFILQGAIRRVLRDIADRRITPRRLHGAGPNAGGRPTSQHPVPRSSRLEYTGIYPRHGPTMFVRRAGAAPEYTPPMPSSLPRPSPMTRLPPPPPPPMSAHARHPCVPHQQRRNGRVAVGLCIRHRCRPPLHLPGCATTATRPLLRVRGGRPLDAEAPARDRPRIGLRLFLRQGGGGFPLLSALGTPFPVGSNDI